MICSICSYSQEESRRQGDCGRRVRRCFGCADYVCDWCGFGIEEGGIYCYRCDVGRKKEELKISKQRYRVRKGIPVISTKGIDLN